MKNDITEKDIFNFVFYPESITKEKEKFLEASSDFIEEVEFYSSLKKSLSDELNIDVKKKIASKIDVYKLENIIYLYPVEELKKHKRSNGLILAAASKEDKPTISTKTFYDADKTYIIKVINYEKISRIFVFSTQYEMIKDFELIILPQNFKYHVADNTAPLELDFIVEPESISLEFNLSKRL